jgi:hypothetical protein
MPFAKRRKALSFSEAEMGRLLSVRRSRRAAGHPAGQQSRPDRATASILSRAQRRAGGLSLEIEIGRKPHCIAIKRTTVQLLVNGLTVVSSNGKINDSAIQTVRNQAGRPTCARSVDRPIDPPARLLTAFPTPSCPPSALVPLLHVTGSSTKFCPLLIFPLASVVFFMLIYIVA